MTTFGKNTNMKSVRQGDFYLIGQVLKCKVLVAIPDEITGREDYMWADTYVPMDVICYFSLNIDEESYSPSIHEQKVTDSKPDLNTNDQKLLKYHIKQS